MHWLAGSASSRGHGGMEAKPSSRSPGGTQRHKGEQFNHYRARVAYAASPNAFRWLYALNFPSTTTRGRDGVIFFRAQLCPKK